MSKDTIIFCLFASAVVYVYSLCTKEFIDNLIIKLKIKHIKESIVYLTIIDKHMVEGLSYSDGHSNKYVSAKLPNSYLIDCIDSNTSKKYTINDKHIFEKHDINDTIKLKLIEKLDKNNNVLESIITTP